MRRKHTRRQYSSAPNQVINSKGDWKMKLGRETGSLINHLLSHSKEPAPAVGMGATILGWSDRHPATVV